jgi:predicted nucleic acid-binding protein
MRFGFSQFDRLMGTFQDVTEVPLSLTACIQSRRIMDDYDLKSYDALHVATARALRLRNFATTDREFRVVTGLRLCLIRDTP